MNRFKFSLDSVLTLRHFRKMEAAGELALSSRERNRASDRLENGRERLQSVEDEFLRILSPGAKARAAEIQMIQNALIEQRENVTQLKKDYLETLENEERARKAVLVAQREYEALVKLETRQRERVRKEANKEDEKIMEEFVSARHVLVKGS